MVKVEVKPGGRSYSVFIGKEILPELGGLLREIIKGGRLLLVSDSNVYPLYGDLCVRSLEDRGFRVVPAGIPSGENSKSISTAEKLYDTAVESGMDRSSPVVALGGGVVGDLAGFVASTFLRGVPFIQVPTTLLAQVDSSVGGKVGINHPRGKNLIGSFYQPRLVVADVSTLNSLPEREYRAGLAEVIKYGLIGDRDFLGWLEKNLDMLTERESDSMIHAVTRSVENKAMVVESDERESGQRRVLNLGHTIGHALEAATGYKYYLHGEAVLIGMDMAVSLSERLELLDHNFAERARSLLRRTGFMSPPGKLSADEVIQRIVYDKKREGDTPVFVLPVSSGEAVIYPGPPEHIIRELLEAYLN